LLLGRRPVEGITSDNIKQKHIDIFDPSSYENMLSGFDVAICTLGVGQPSKMSKEDFAKIDKQAVADFAKACKNVGVHHFELLSFVGIHSKSSSFYLRTKAELVDELKGLNFNRLSIFQPSMILTPKNRYGFLQGLTLLDWPLFHPILFGNLKKFRGVKVSVLGKAIASNIFTNSEGFEMLDWKDFQDLIIRY
jgi:uncharacterized protein YbjT (DUF2867 family)